WVNGAARNVQHVAHPPPRVLPEARGEEVGLGFPIELEGDVIVEGRGIGRRAATAPVRGGQRRPHHVRIASRTIAAAVIAVRPDGSQRGETSTRSKPTTWAAPRCRSAV